MDLEKVLYEWFKQKRAAGQPVTSVILQEKALLINEKIKSDPKFKASRGWLTNFNKRYNIRSCTMQGEELSADHESAVEFVDDLARIMREGNFKLFQVYNADETGLYWKMMPRISFVTEYENRAEGFKISKQHVTVMACANADGTHKIPLFLIGTSKNPRCFKDIQQLPVEYRNQKNAWMTREIFKIWLTNVLIPSVKAFQKKDKQCFINLG